MNVTEANSTDMPKHFGFDNSLSALYIINLVLGLPANSYVMWVIASGEGGAVVSELFSLNLAISEILLCLFSVSIIVKYFVTLPTKITLKVLRYFSVLMFTPRPVFHSSICVERYLAVVHPVVFLRFRVLRYKLACCAFCWLLVVTSCIVSSFMPSYIELGLFLATKTSFSLVLMSYCGISVLRALKRPGPGDGDGQAGNGMKMRAFKIILINLVFTFVTQLPIILMTPLLFGQARRVNVMAFLANVSIAIVGGFLTPLLYLHRAGKLPCFRF